MPDSLLDAVFDLPGSRLEVGGLAAVLGEELRSPLLDVRGDLTVAGAPLFAQGLGNPGDLEIPFVVPGPPVGLGRSLPPRALP
jgi:hypothetical protein